MEQLIAKTRQRVRLLRAFRWGSWSVLGTLVASLIYLTVSRLGWIGADLDSFLLAFNGAGFIIGLIVGAVWPVKTQRVLLEMDQKLGTGEVLLTLHHLQQKDKQNDFTEILSHKFDDLNVQPQAVFHVNQRDWKRGGGVLAALLLVVAFVWAGPIWLPSMGINSSALGSNGSSVESAMPGRGEVPEQFQEQLEELQRRLEELGIEQPLSQQDLNQNQSAGEPQDQFIELFEDLQRAQNQALGLEGGEGAGQNTAQARQQQQQQREALENLQQQLEQLMMQWADGDASGESQEAAESLRDQLDALPEDDPLRQHLEDALSQGDSEARQQALENAQQDLQDRLDADQNLDDLRQSLEEWAQNQPSSEFGSESDNREQQTSQQNSDQSNQNQEGSENEDGELDPNASPNSPATANEPQQIGDDTGSPANQPGEGNEAGSGNGNDGQPNLPPNWNPEYKNATIPPGMVPADSIEEWLSRGVPVETSDTPGESVQFRLSFDQVEALLDLRELSPEMRDIVRLYFLQIIGELNQAESSDTDGN